ncbi:hypothetical protein [Paraburkholderia sp. JPY419]|uniref:hypothetical protein n=1 Tax=Paraburkholderia sp. JPY419 TaxID=667660 RepID=UPI003D19842C
MESSAFCGHQELSAQRRIANLQRAAPSLTFEGKHGQSQLFQAQRMPPTRGLFLQNCFAFFAMLFARPKPTFEITKASIVQGDLFPNEQGRGQHPARLKRLPSGLSISQGDRRRLASLSPHAKRLEA